MPKITEEEANRDFLRRVRQERDELMDRINDLDRLEVSIIKMMGGDKWK